MPPLLPVGPGHRMRCWLAEEQPSDRRCSSVRDLVKHYTSGGFLRRRCARRARGGRGVLRRRPRGDPGARRRIGLRQVIGGSARSCGCRSRRAARRCSRGSDIFSLDRAALRRLRRRMQIIFQDPYSSLNPRMTVGAAVAEGIEIHRLAAGAEVGRRVASLLEEVGLDPSLRRAVSRTNSPAASGSGSGSRARSRSSRPSSCATSRSPRSTSRCRPRCSTCWRDLQRDRGLAYLFIAHDLAVVRQIAHRIAVMYLGPIVEQGPAEEVLARAPASVHRGPPLRRAGAASQLGDAPASCWEETFRARRIRHPGVPFTPDAFIPAGRAVPNRAANASLNRRHPGGVPLRGEHADSGVERHRVGVEAGLRLVSYYVAMMSLTNLTSSDFPTHVRPITAGAASPAQLPRHSAAPTERAPLQAARRIHLAFTRRP